VDLDANIQGKFTFGGANGLQLLNVPLSPFGVAGVFSIGPSLNLAVQASAGIQVFGSVHAGSTFALPEQDFFVQILGDGTQNTAPSDPGTSQKPTVTNDFSADIAMQGAIK